MTEDEDLPDDLRHLLWSTANEFAAVVHRSTKPLVYSHAPNRIPSLIGGSVLVQVGPAFMLLTARHVLDAIPEGEGVNVFTPPAFASVRGTYYKTQANAAGADPLDACVFDLHDSSVTDDMRESAIPIQVLNRQGAEAGEIVQLIGFPSNRFDRIVEKRVTPQWMQFVGVVLAPDDLDAGDHTAHTHTAFDLDPLTGQDESGIGRRAPKLSGMSGSGIWLVGSPRPERMLGTLLAIFTDHLPAKRPRYALGTNVSVHVSLILRYRPDLARYIL